MTDDTSNDGGVNASAQGAANALAQSGGASASVDGRRCANDIVCGVGRRCDKPENSAVGVCVDDDEMGGADGSGGDGSGGDGGGGTVAASGGAVNGGENNNEMNLNNGAGRPSMNDMGGDDGAGGDANNMGGGPGEPDPITFETDRRALVQFEEVFTEGMAIPITPFSVEFKSYDALPPERPVGEAWPDAMPVPDRYVWLLQILR